MSGLLGISSKFFSEGVHNAIKSVNDSKALAAAVITKSQSDTALVMAASGMLIMKAVEVKYFSCIAAVKIGKKKVFSMVC